MTKNQLTKSLVFGFFYGAIDSLLMLPIPMEGKAIAILGAFFSRFAIGFLIPLVKLNLPGWGRGLVVSLLISLPDAIITATYLPIMLTGLVGGMIIGWIDDKWNPNLTKQHT